MRSETTGKRIARVNAGDWVGSLVNRARILAKDREDARQVAAARQAGPTLQERRDDLVRFYERYEDLVEVLCDAAQYGPTPKLESQYATLKTWMAENYPTVRPFLLAFLREEDSEQDAFAALTAQETLDHALRCDDGSMISKITRTREALNLYGEHLRQLTARNA